MSKCPTCGADSQRIESAVGGGSGIAPPWQAIPGQTMAAGDITVPPGMRYERRTPAAEPKTAHVATALGYAIGTLAVALITSALLALVTWSLNPLKIGAVIGGIAAALVWIANLLINTQLLWKVEELTNLDINRDGAKGPPPEPPEPIIQERFIPVNASKTKIVQQPVPIAHDIAPGHEWITIREADERHSARMWRKRDLWAFVIAAYNNNWTRDYWQELGIGQKEWADLKTYLSRFNMWMCADSPTLAAWLSATGHPGTNEQQRTERTEDT